MKKRNINIAPRNLPTYRICQLRVPTQPATLVAQRTEDGSLLVLCDPSASLSDEELENVRKAFRQLNKPHAGISTAEVITRFGPAILDREI